MRHMPGILAICIVAVLAAHAGRAQEADPAGTDAGDEPPEVGAEAAIPDDTAEDDGTADTDDTDPGSYLDIEEDDFRPSEEVPADQSIDFPTDI